MANQKHRGLNRGLEHLLGDLGQEVLDQPAPEMLRELPISELQAGKYQPRQHFDDAMLSELASSIAEHGILQPLVVRSIGKDKYEIIAGERRFRAAQQVGLKTVPSVVKNYTDKQALAVALIENLQRSDLTVLEVAVGLQKLVDDFTLTHERVAQLVGRSRSSVTNLLRLLDLSETAKKALQDGQMEMGHARALLSLNAAQQEMLTNEIIAKKLTVRDAEKRVRQMKKPLDKAPKKLGKNTDIAALENTLSDFMGFNVAINPKKKGGGKLVLKYKNLDELDAILAKWGYKSEK